MIQTGFESRIRIQDVIENQLPEYVLDESPKTVDFLKQYYISQEFQGGVVDIVENLDQYLKVDNLIPEVIVENINITGPVSSTDTTIVVSGTKGFPNKYGLLKIDDEIITYTGLTTNTFTGCIRGFSGITSYHSDLNQEELVFTQTEAASHSENSKVQNLSSLFLKEFYKKFKYTFTPGFEDRTFYSNLDVGNFIKNARSFYQSKGTDESFRILFNVLFGETPKVINLEEYLLKSSDAEYIRREVVIADLIGSGNPLNIIGQSIFKTDDSSTTASISAVEPFTRGNKTYFKLSLFVGYDDRSSSIEGIFKITPNTKCLERVELGSSVISVDSTIGFEKSGTILSGSNLISYTDKSINQFLNCSGIENTILPTDDITSSTETYYAYENGDTSKKVELRLTGVISDFIPKSEYILADEGQTLTVKHLGDSIKNPEGTKTYKEVFANSWIYNTNSSIEVDDINGGIFTLKSIIDRSHFKKGDIIEITDTSTGEVKFPIYNNSGNIISDIPYVDEEISFGSKIISISGLSGFDSNSSSNFSIRRKINKAYSFPVPFKYGNQSIISDIQNIYTEDDKFAYVASNSLPSSGVGFTDFKYNIEINLIESSFESSDSLIDKDEETDFYTTILFDSPVPFITGDRIYYQSEFVDLIGLEEGSYYIKVLSDPDPNLNKKKVKLFTSLSFIDDDSNAIRFSFPDSGVGFHRFTLYSQKSRELNPPKLLRKFSLNPNIKNGSDEETIPGPVGMLINGVEIFNYKSKDKVYYGPIKNVSVLNGGEDFDLLNPPKVEISSGLGITALVQPVITGEIKDIIIDTQDFDIDKVLSVNVSGGNVNGGNFNAVSVKRRREVLLDGRTSSEGGGISTSTSQLIFLSDHNFIDGQEIVYRNNGNSNIVVGSGISSLVNNGVYYAKVDNNQTIQIFGSYNNYLSNTNPIQFYDSSPGGNHKFLTNEVRNTISEIEILDGGTLTNRKLLVKPSGISTSNHTINFENHNFSNGDIVEYSPVSGLGTITGLSTANQYYVLINDNDKNSFRLCDAGIGGTITTNFNQQKIVKFSSTGSGFQQFKYPDVEVSLTFTVVGLGTTTQTQTITATPVIKGSISDLYLYESGTGYGSTTLNFHKKPIITIKNGKDARIEPIIVNGLINDINIQFGGVEYFSIPELKVVDPTGSGSGAKLRAVISNGKITDVEIIQKGIGYSSSTVINVVSSGKNAVLDSNVRDLTVNFVEKISTPRYSTFSEVVPGQGLQYFVSGYYDKLRSSFKDNGNRSSRIIGWAYDGNPIYGSYLDTSTFAQSGYTKDSSNVLDRPSTSIFSEGFFVEDYNYDGNGDLDENNGRYAITEDFPNGVYAYYATVDQTTGNPVFPYFIGNTFRSKTLEENKLLNQEFDFNNSNLIRNTFPYKIAERFADNDFIIESNEIKNQKIKVESVSKGSITGFNIINSGDNYKVGDNLSFDNTNTSGGDLRVKVSSIKGKSIDNVQTTFNEYQNSVFVWKKDKVLIYTPQYHELLDKDNIIISGFSTSTLTKLNNSYSVSVSPIQTVGITTQISSGSNTTEIYVTNIPSQVSAGTSIQIGNEILEVLNIFPSKNILRVKRGNPGISHNIGTSVQFKNNLLTIDAKLDYFKSNLNNKVYFNPTESIGLGTEVGIGSDVTFNFGNETISRSIPTQSIFLENHPFATNQKVSFSTNGNSNISISTSPSSPLISLPSTAYIVNKTSNTIGIKTSLTTNEVFFVSNGQDKDDYYFETNFDQELGLVESIKTTVSISTSHELSFGDSILLRVKPNLNVGIGTSTAVRIIRDTNTENILVNPIGFSSSQINTSTNQITLSGHNLNTGDKVIYNADEVASSLETGFYYIHKVNDNNIKLCETYVNSISNPPTIINLTGIGGSSHTLYNVNPQINSIKNNNLVFDTSDSSLSGYKFKLYYDNGFINEFVSTGSTSIISISKNGTEGTNGSTVTVTYNENIPEKLYYSLEKDGTVITPDKDVNNYSEILFVDSKYTGKYTITGVATTTFNINLTKKPEKLSYTSAECDSLEYTTTSLSAKGPVDKLKLISSGINYKKPPELSGSDSQEGKNLYIIAKSTDIGKIQKVRVINQGFEYSSDRTLQPQSFISPNIKLKNSSEIDTITVTSGGKNYVKEPNIVLVDNATRESINNGILKPVLSGNSISNVIVEISPKGISDQSAELFATNNTNGLSIVRINSNSSGIFTCSITTPVTGFTINPFSVNDEVFVEGIQKYGSSGDGFNSEDYGYKFFTVKAYSSGGVYGDEVTLEVPGSNTGIAKTIQDSTGVIVNRSNYPTFSVAIKPSLFEIGEKLLSNGNEVDLQIDEYTDPISPKVLGTYQLSVGEVITGKTSKTVATIQDLEEYYGNFTVDFSSRRNEGWNKDTGKLNQDYQVLSDNDYYQNLSYSIKSSKEWKDIRTPVNNLVHTSGLKNFSDTEIISKSEDRAGINSVTISNENIVKDIITENRVDTINGFDFVVDTDVINDTSRFLKLKNKRLSDYIEIDSSIVLRIDDISSEFSNIDDGDSINKTNFVLKNKGTPIFAKTFDPSDSSILDLSTGIFSIENHFFSDDEELIYRQLGVGATPMVYVDGAVSGILPSSVFVTNKSDSTFQISTTRSGSAVTFSSFGGGDTHQFAMAKNSEKSIIAIDNIVQYPISSTNKQSLLSNNGGGITTSSYIFSLSGISSINSGDILRIDDEYMEVINVGLGTQNTGPITNTGLEKLVEVERAFVGTATTSHTDGTSVGIYRGSFNIVGDEIFFTKAPRGNSSIDRNDNNLVFNSSDFNGRVFLRKNYETNAIFDDISDDFTGIGRTFTLTVGGANTTGIGTTGGNGVVFINGIFQTPTTENNTNNNFSIVENTIAGITSIVFSGIRSDINDSNSTYISESDVNQNQIPRGGIIISLGSTGGIGYAPLVGASVTAIVGAGGSIVGVNTAFTGGTYGSGYNGIVSIGISVYDPTQDVGGDPASITATVGAGGSLSFNIGAGGTGYNNPQIFVSEPSYENLEVIGVSRLGIGATTETGIGLLMNIEVGESFATGIGSTYFGVSNFSIARSGYSFKKGDVFEPVGLVADSRLASPISDFRLTVLETFSDNFAAWQFGELDFIDSVKNYQDGRRVRFPLFYNGDLLSFEKKDESSEIDLANSLLIIINGVIQDPGVSYNFNGGTSFTFTEAPKSDDNIAIFFYRGTRNEDDTLVSNIFPSLERGDTVQVLKNNDVPGSITQDKRIIFDITQSDKFETNPYFGNGITETSFGLLSWTKQKTDRVVNGEFVYKTRESILSQTYPTAKVIGNVSTSDNYIFVDNADIFNYEGPGTEFSSLLIEGKETRAGSVSASIGLGGTVTSLSIIDPGIGYTGSNINVEFSKPNIISQLLTIGIGTTIISGVTTSVLSGITSVASNSFIANISDRPGTITGSASTIGINTSSITIGQVVICDTAGIISAGATVIGIGTDNVSISTSSLSVSDVTSTFDFGISTSIIDSGTEIVSIGIGSIYLNKPTLNTSTLTNVDVVFGYGVGTTATATITVGAGGTLTSPIIISDPGSGYNNTPIAILPSPEINFENIPKIVDVKGFSGVVTGITTTTNAGQLALTFNLRRDTTFGSDLQSGYPIFIKNTSVGSGATSIENSDSEIVGIGTTFLDNIYYVSQISNSGNTASITCNVHSNSPVSGISTSGDYVGEFSWGRFGTVTRSSSPISLNVFGNTVDVGLTTFSSIQRRGSGLRQNGSLIDKIQ